MAEPGVGRGPPLPPPTSTARSARLIADTQRSTLESNTALDPKQPTSRATSRQKETARQEGGPTCLTRRTRLRASAKARTQQSPPRLLRRHGPGRTGTVG